jgi:S1-C subfamily serine protease
VPFLNAFTGAHEDYHRPSDTPDKVNYDGAEKVAKFIGLVARSLVTADAQPDYKEVEAPQMPSGGMRAYLGTIPDYAEEVKGVKLSGVTKGAPAEAAGLEQGDIIVELAGRKIENIYDYTYALEAVKPNEEIGIAVERAGERVELKITPKSRD